MDTQLILNSSNARTTATVQGKTVNDLDGAPLGKTGSGEVAAKVLLVNPGDVGTPNLGAAAGATLISSTAYEASHVLKASPGTLIALIGYNSKASAQFIQVFNSATLPSDGGVPIATFTVAASNNFSLTIPLTGLPMSAGIVVCNSSTGPTKTIDAADCWFTAVVK